MHVGDLSLHNPHQDSVKKTSSPTTRFDTAPSSPPSPNTPTFPRNDCHDQTPHPHPQPLPPRQPQFGIQRARRRDEFRQAAAAPFHHSPGEGSPSVPIHPGIATGHACPPWRRPSRPLPTRRSLRRTRRKPGTSPLHPTPLRRPPHRRSPPKTDRVPPATHGPVTPANRGARTPTAPTSSIRTFLPVSSIWRLCSFRCVLRQMHGIREDGPPRTLRSAAAQTPCTV